MKKSERPVDDASRRLPYIDRGFFSLGFSQFFQDSHRRMAKRANATTCFHLFALVLVAMLGALPNAGQAKETIVWLVRDFPPLTIISGPYAGQGAIDKLMPELIARMPEYNHEIIHVNRARGTQILQDPDIFACDPTMLWTPERDKTILFSIPTYATPGNGVTIERKNHSMFAPYLTSEGQLDLTALLDSNTVKVGIVGERSYGPVIDRAIKEKRQANTLIVHYGNTAVGSLLQMERMQRFQAFISYLPEARFHAQQQNIPAQELEFFSVKDTPKYQFAHIACSKTDQGRAAMEIINREMRVLRTSKLIGFYADWMLKREEYLHDAQRFFDEK
jgi:uncharacterized protein (TIGR02285 family)